MTNAENDATRFAALPLAALPLAARMRLRNFGKFVGQKHRVGATAPLRAQTLAFANLSRQRSQKLLGRTHLLKSDVAKMFGELKKQGAK